MIAFTIGTTTYGATMSTDEVAREFGCSTDVLYEGARLGTAPVEPLRLGTRLRWPTARVMAALGITAQPAPAADLDDLNPERTGAQ